MPTHGPDLVAHLTSLALQLVPLLTSGAPSYLWWQMACRPMDLRWWPLLPLVPPLTSGGPSYLWWPRLQVRAKVEAKLEALGIHKVDGMRLVGLEGDDTGTLTSVQLETDGGSVVAQPCNLLLCAGAHEVRPPSEAGALSRLLLSPAAPLRCRGGAASGG